MITCAIVSGTVYFKQASKIILDIDSFFLSINRFYKEISSCPCNSKNKLEIHKLIELFYICFF
jgi:hypothetical protein